MSTMHNNSVRPNFDESVDRISNLGVTKLLYQKLKQHHELYNEADLKPVGDHMEFLLKKSFHELGVNCEKTTAHKVGTDLIVKWDNEQELKISMKSGKEKEDVLELSSFRTTSQNTLPEKIKYCQVNLSNDDLIISVLARPVENGIRYQVLAINTQLLNLEQLEWKPEVNAKGKENFVASGKFEAKIVTSMSGQLWLSLPMSFTKTIDDFTIFF
jgi:hypothetical protein